MSRVTWTGAISFGLVHIPVALYPAARDERVHFEWLDRRSLDPVGYRRFNKRTGKELKPADIVKGVKQENGEYVVLTDEEIRAAFPRTTQSIDIEGFIKAKDLPLMMLETPYYLEPTDKAERVYALLREAIRAADVIGVARLVMHNKEHLAALYVSGPALVLNTIRWTHEIRPLDELKFPGHGTPAPTLKAPELKMAAQLILAMQRDWDAQEYSDHFADAVHELVRRKVAAGESREVAALEEAPPRPANVVDLTALLADSLKRAPRSGEPARRAAQAVVRRPGTKRAVKPRRSRRA